MVEYFIDRGVLGVTKDVQHPVLEYTTESVAPGTRWKFDSSGSLVIPVMPPTLLSVCRLVQVYYVLKVNPKKTFSCQKKSTNWLLSKIKLKKKVNLKFALNELNFCSIRVDIFLLCGPFLEHWLFYMKLAIPNKYLVNYHFNFIVCWDVVSLVPLSSGKGQKWRKERDRSA